MNPRLNWKLTCIAFLCWIIFLPLFSIVHEYGHAYSCYIQGHKFEVHMGLFGNYTSCIGKIIEPTSYRIAGGFFGASVPLVIYAVLKNFLRGTSKGIAIALVTVGVTQFYNMIIETFANDFYMTGNINTGINSMIALVLLFVLIKVNSKPYKVSRIEI